MADFAQALLFVLQNEGTAYVNDAADAGGPTRMGVTQATLSSWKGSPATIDEVKGLTLAQVEPIYRKFYWAIVHGDTFASQALATVVMDCGVLCGPSRANRMLRNCRMGSAVADFESSYVAMCFCAAYGDYLSAVAKRPGQSKFLKGWLRRVERCRELVRQYYTHEGGLA